MKTTLKASVAAAALFAVSAPVVSSPAEAGLANGNDNGVVISGALNRSMQYVDNGSANSWVNTDGGTDNSRLRILVSGQLTESIKVGGTWEAKLPI
jgi:predicted porin